MKHLKAVIVFICIVFIAVSPAFAEELKKINLDEAVKLSISNNLDLQGAKMNIDLAKNNIKVANRLQNPDFNVFYNFGRAGHGNPQQIGLSETIEIAKRGARKNLAKSTLEWTRDSYFLNEFNLKMDVRSSYVNLVAAKSILKSLEEQQALLQELVTIAQKRFDAGASPEMDVIQARIALNQMVTQVNSARVNVKAARYDFNKSLNIKDAETVFDTEEELLPTGSSFISLMTPKAQFQMPDFKEIQDGALDKRFDIKVARQGIDVAEKNLSVVKRQRIPDLAILGGYGYQGAKTSDTGTFQTGGYAGASLTNIPLLYSYRPEIKNAKIQVDQAKLNYESTSNKAVKDLCSAYEKFVTAQLNLNYYDEKLVKDSEELIEISKRSYEVGKSNLTSLIVMEQSYKSIIVGYTMALAEYYNCWIDFIREVNNEEFVINEENI